MAANVWFPVGLQVSDNSFAPPLFGAAENGVLITTPFQFVVPGVIPLSKVQNEVRKQQSSLARQRSVVRFPLEPAGAAVSFWDD